MSDERRLAVLAFHKVGDPSPGAWETWFYSRESELVGSLDSLREQGWQVIDAATLVRGIERPDCLPARAAVLTFDDGYRSVLQVAAPVLNRAGCPAIVFVPTACVGQGSHCFDAGSAEPEEPLCDWDELRELEARGISVQSHGVTHRAFSALDPAQQEVELRDSRAVLEERLQKPVQLFAFPYGDGGREPLATGSLLRRTGYRAAFLYDGRVNRAPLADPFRLSRLPLGRWSDPRTELERLLDCSSHGRAP